ncbi:MAG TPA: cytochrome P450 [Verrucomicrobiales bacterium]|nr:cytochrome P450 [Verrucomicrobiales bacterium]
MDLFSDAVRRDPYPLYDAMRRESPVLHVPPPFDGWMIFDHDGVKRALFDHEAFSSQVPAPRHWFIFTDPPIHTKLRGLISRAFTPRTVAALEPCIRTFTRGLLDQALESGIMDMAADFAVPLPAKVIATMIGIPVTDWPQFKTWMDAIMKLSFTRSGGEAAEQGMKEFAAASSSMNEYLGGMIAERRARPQDDLLTRLMEPGPGGETLSQPEILGFFQVLVVAGQETTTNLINNAILCFLEHPDQLRLLRSRPTLLPSAIEEVLRFRSPLQWTMRTPRRDIEMHGRTIPAGKLVLPMLGSANRDGTVFTDANRFDITRNPNPHIAFGHGIHFCLGAALARTEAAIALTEFLERVSHFEWAENTPWQPRQALNVHGPASLRLRIRKA